MERDDDYEALLRGEMTSSEWVDRLRRLAANRSRRIGTNGRARFYITREEAENSARMAGRLEASGHLETP